ncbi:MAG: SAM-dependent methyltransferase [Candidatus Micrarchaeota archaeon]|nr:SAM-dependent methyltransferase [Candidatus Micrarchaeota archaeon]
MTSRPPKIVDPISKREINRLFYAAERRELPFATQAGFEPYQEGVVRIIRDIARQQGSERLRIMELGANDCSFAMDIMGRLANDGIRTGVDYLAVDFSASALDKGYARYSQMPGKGFEMVRNVEVPDSAKPNGKQDNVIYLVQRDAAGFKDAWASGLDVVIMNELLDDLSYDVYFTDKDGRAYRLECSVSRPQLRWQVNIDAERVDRKELPVQMPPRSVTATSAEAMGIIENAAALLRKGGVMLVHDYGFADRYDSVDTYGTPNVSYKITQVNFPKHPQLSMPYDFFRVYEDVAEFAFEPASNMIQVTSPVNFGEIEARLEKEGKVLILPHGRIILHKMQRGESLAKGDDVFMSEFGLMEQDETVAGIMDSLKPRQQEIIDYHGKLYSPDFYDLVFLKR